VNRGEVRKEIEFMRAVFRSGTPAFGSCAGLQLATVAAGGSVRPNRNGHEAAFARRIVPTDEGLRHPLLAGRPRAFDAPAIHSDEVESLPPGGTLLASNAVTEVQAAEIRCDGGIFWGVQYHPEISLGEVAAALRRQAEDLITHGLAVGRDDLEQHAGLIDALHAEPERKDLAWRLGLDREVTDDRRRARELHNFVRTSSNRCARNGAATKRLNPLPLPAAAELIKRLKQTAQPRGVLTSCYTGHLSAAILVTAEFDRPVAGAVGLREAEEDLRSKKSSRNWDNRAGRGRNEKQTKGHGARPSAPIPCEPWPCRRS
jgi:GMP synthase (glutamine-hydrolysing)